MRCPASHLIEGTWRSLKHPYRSSFAWLLVRDTFNPCSECLTQN